MTAVQVGTSILFPNKDNIRHHVYSLSSAKKFELPLYKGVPAEPVVFDKEGFVTLGCNIHDWMIAYVAVLGTPYFQVTGREGHALLKNLPPGQYTLRFGNRRSRVHRKPSRNMWTCCGRYKAVASSLWILSPAFASSARRGSRPEDIAELSIPQFQKPAPLFPLCALDAPAKCDLSPR